MKNYLFFFVFVLFVGAAQAQFRTDTSTYTLMELINMDLEDILRIKVNISTKTEIDFREAPSVVSVITSQEIQAMGARDLRDVLRTVPGFQLGYNRLGYDVITLRGIRTANSEKIKIMIDDIPVNETLEGGGTVVFGYMPVENIDRIEIIRGPGSALYGTSAGVGVINIITKNSKKNMEASVSVGSYNTVNANISAQKKYKDFSIAANINYVTTDGAKINIEDDLLLHDTLNHAVSLAGTSKGLTHYNRKEFRCGLNMNLGEWYLKTNVNDIHKAWTIGTHGSLSEDNEAHPFQFISMFGGKIKPTNRISIEPRFYTNYYNVSNLWNDQPDGYRTYNAESKTYTNYTKGLYSLNGATQWSNSADVKLSIKLSEKNDLVAGASYDWLKLFNLVNRTNQVTPETGKDNLQDIESIMKKEPIRQIAAVYLQDQWKIANNLTLTTGLRFDHYNDAGSTLNPRIALVWLPKQFGFKLLYGKAFRAPAFVESYLNAYSGFITGNESNKPENIQTYEAEFSCKLSPNLNFRINYFYNTIDKLIDLNYFYTENPDGTKTLRYIEYNNTNATTLVQGIETELRYVLKGKWNAYINYSYNDGESKSPDGTKTKLSGIANHIANAGATVVLGKYINLNATLTYVGKTQQAKTDTRKPINAYTYASLNIIGRNFIKNMEVNLSLHNLFNSDVRYYDAGLFLANHYPVEDFNVMFGVRYRF